MKYLPILLLAAGAAHAQDCSLSFEMEAGNAIGTILPGTPLQGEATYTITGVWQERDTTTSYYSEGSMTVTAPDGSSVTADVTTVHVIRTPWTADYVSFDATDAAGDLGGESRYVDPMLLTLFGRPGVLKDFGMPSGEDWEALDVRRTFQVHTPTTMEVFIGPVTAFEGTCLE
ncbi:hypothetical protein [Pontivivens insulae]|uniref:Uncharacterized protein n=1 Tax=Pontivivens insulae TaxID=1639689 RepID=A0A2R8ADS6_9RHOB|nr:hypothetical protein [Pontivivens insulae]RED14324.1 hypothetical protein DFR53_1681 [Pontivivens insulae]SPF30401.1 hypothetical protein POI8812_02737 [Pontivivens insulae]